MMISVVGNGLTQAIDQSIELIEWDRQAEAQHINKSLSFLEQVVVALGDPTPRRHIPYRSCKVRPPILLVLSLLLSLLEDNGLTHKRPCS